MIKVGITGLLASGKTTVAKVLSGKKYPIFNADREVKKVYQRKLFKDKIFKKFNVKTKKEIKKIISKNPKKLIILEKFIHPFVRKEMQYFIKKNKRKKILLFEIPLLIESKLMRKFDKIIFVNCKRSLRVRRFLKRGKSKKLFDLLDKRQSNSKKKKQLSDYVINNNFSFQRLKDNVKILENIIIIN